MRNIWLRSCVRTAAVTIVALAVVVSLGAQTPPQGSAPTSMRPPTSGGARPNAPAPNMPPSTAPPPAAPQPGPVPGAIVPPAGYIIGADDVLVVSVWGDQAYTTEQVVRPDGKITL